MFDSIDIEDLLIDPSEKDAVTVSGWLRRDNSVRGLMIDECLVVFRSYGHTHGSVAAHFIRKDRRNTVQLPLVILKNGDVFAIDVGVQRVVDVFKENTAFFRKLGKLVGNNEPRIIHIGGEHNESN